MAAAAGRLVLPERSTSKPRGSCRVREGAGEETQESEAEVRTAPLWAGVCRLCPAMSWTGAQDLGHPRGAVLDPRAQNQSQSQGLIRSFPLDFPHQPAQDFRLGERMALGTCEGRGLGTQYDLLGTLGPRWSRRGEPGPCVLSTPVYRTDRDSDRLNPTCQAPRGGWARDQVGVRGPCGAFPSSLRFRRKQLPRGPVVSGQLCHQPSQEKGL